MSQNVFYSIPELRRRLGDIGRSKAYDLLKRHNVKITKIGRRSTIEATEYARLAEAIRRESEAASAAA